jgi:hypothetical protein
VKEKSIKSKLNIFEKFRHALDTIAKPSTTKIIG